MTNSELLALYPPGRPTGLLGHMDKQRLFVLRIMTTQMPCPNCGTLQSPLEARGIMLDDYDVREHHEPTVHCIGCLRELRYTVPFIQLGNPWHWSLVPVTPSMRSGA